MKATEKQVRYMFVLLGKAGYDTRRMNAKFKDVGARMAQRTGSVEDWLRSRTAHEASEIIEKLLAQQPAAA